MTLHLRSLFVILLFAAGGSLYAQIGIGTQTPNDNAALEIKSPDKGLLIPRIDLAAETTFLNGTGANENGMFVYHTGADLSGEGLYVWQYNSTSSSGKWVKFATGTSIDTGTTANATLRWDNSENKWVEEDGLQVTTDGNVTVGGTLTVTGAVTASDALTVSGLLTASNGLTVSSGAVDLGSGTVDLGTGAVTADGNLTLNSGNLAVTSGTLTVGGISTLTGNVTVTGTSEFTGAVTSKGDLSVTNDGSGTKGNFSVDGTSTLKGNVSLESGATLTVADGAVNLGTAKTTAGSLDVTGDTKLSGKLTASDGTTGTDGQILTATSEGKIKWTTPDAAPTVKISTATESIDNNVGTLIINAADSGTTDVVITLPTDAEEGHTLKIRRNFDYTISSSSPTDAKVKIKAGTSQKINGQDEKNLNVGYQSVTLVYIGGTNKDWVSID